MNTMNSSSLHILNLYSGGQINYIKLIEYYKDYITLLLDRFERKFDEKLEDAKEWWDKGGEKLTKE